MVRSCFQCWEFILMPISATEGVTSNLKALTKNHKYVLPRYRIRRQRNDDDSKFVGGLFRQFYLSISSNWPGVVCCRCSVRSRRGCFWGFGECIWRFWIRCWGLTSRNQGELEKADEQKLSVAYDTLYPGHGHILTNGLETIATYIKHRMTNRRGFTIACPSPDSDDREQLEQGQQLQLWTTWNLVRHIYKS